MSTNATPGHESPGTAVESTTENEECEECAKLDDGFPCADCYISGKAEFSGEYA